MQGIRGHYFRNWSKTFSCRPELYFEPTSAEELRQILDRARSATKHVKIVGCGHSPSDIPCTSDYMVSMRKMRSVVGIERTNDEKSYVRVQSGIQLRELNDYIHCRGLELPVQGSIGDITIGGMVSTGTHGSSTQYGSVCSVVHALQLMTVSGDILECNREQNVEVFLAATCGIGAVGVILEVTLECVTARNLKIQSYGAKLNEILARIDERQKACDHFEFFWFPHTDDVKVVEHTRTSEEPRKSGSWFWDYFIGYYLLEFILWISTFCNFLVPWINRFFYRLLFKAERTSVGRADHVLHFECLFSQYVSEWSIPRHHVGKVFEGLKDYFARSGYRAHFPVEVRFVKGDDIWLSPAFGGDRCYINIICYRPYGKKVPYEDYFDNYENLMFRLEGRPHWAKTHKLHGSQLRSLYPKWDDFQAIRKTYDPHGMLLNRYLEQVFHLGAKETAGTAVMVI